MCVSFHNRFFVVVVEALSDASLVEAEVESLPSSEALQ